MKTTTLIAAAVLTVLLGTSCRKGETDRDIFLQMDTNKDGKLSSDEVYAFALPRLYGRFDRSGQAKVTLEEVRAVDPNFDEKAFRQRDLNGDGKVTFAEYRRYALKNRVLDEIFVQVDTDRDGFITQAEAEAFTAKRAD